MSLFVGRYAFKGDPRRGGMADVHRAFDTIEFEEVAVKLFTRGRLSDDVLAETFRREVRALKQLDHPGIVRLRDSGKDTATETQFLVLDWVESDLSKQPKPAYNSWSTFYADLGESILQALAFAHSRGVVHRDIKPSNILLGPSGPRLADFGVSKLKSWLEPSLTLNQFQSRPFAAPEDNDGTYEFSRDIFSFAAIALQSIDGATLLEYDDLERVLESCDAPNDVRDVLERCISRSPSARPQHAQALLAEISSLPSARSKRTVTSLYLSLTNHALTKLVEDSNGRTRFEVERALLEDLSGSVSIVTKPSNDGRDRQFSLYGSEYSYHVALSSIERSRISILNAKRVPADLIERRHATCYAFECRPSFSQPPQPGAAEASILELLEAISEHETERLRAELEAREESVLDEWTKLLNAKDELDREKQRPLLYKSWHKDGDHYEFLLSAPPSEQPLGENRRIDEHGHTLLNGEVIECEGTSLTLLVVKEPLRAIASRGTLLLDDRAASQSIRRQRSALDAVRYGRAARSDLKTLLLRPETCVAPTTHPVARFFNSKLDEAKQQAVSQALGTTDILVVEGPPGTGKTSFITEVILQLLARDNSTRILVASQTHVAVDNVLEKLQAHLDDIRATRIARADNERVSKNVQGMLLEPQVNRWADAAVAAGGKYLERLALELGFTKSNFEISTLLRNLASLRTAIAAGQRESTELELHIAALAQGNAASADDLDKEDVNERLRVLRIELSRQQLEHERIEQRLTEVEPDFSALIDSSPADLDAWAETYVPTSSRSKQFAALAELQAYWHSTLLRAGDFESVIIADSHVVGGTCVGIASARGISDTPFDYCIVDEASKATPTELLVPMSLAKTIILVGDTRQLPPFIEDDLRERIRQSGDPALSRVETETLFARLSNLLPSDCQALLSQQHRMVPAIAGLISHCFYENRLTSRDQSWDTRFASVLPRPVTWITTSGRNARRETETGSGFRNNFEITVVVELLAEINGIQAQHREAASVLVIAGYRDQVAGLTAAVLASRNELPWLNIEVNTVDAAQGREADLAIYSVVRSNPALQLGFLRESRRLNVALSRARQNLVIVGDHVFCREAKGENPFQAIVSYIETHANDCTVRDMKK